MTEPRTAVPLYDYQLDWLRDRSRFKIGMWSRQVGKTFAVTLEIVDDMMAAKAQGRASPWLVLSRGDRQAREAMRSGIQTHARAYGLVIKESEYELDIEGQKFKAQEWDAGGGNIVTALPANPATRAATAGTCISTSSGSTGRAARSGGHIYPVDHEGLEDPGHVDAATEKREVLRADDGRKLPVVAPRDRHPPRDRGREPGRRRGAPRTGLADEDLWRQEYLCEWLDEASAWLPYDLIDSCESPLAGRPELYAGGPVLLIGNDIGRKRHLWCTWAAEMVGDVAWTREIKTLKGQPFKVQDDGPRRDGGPLPPGPAGHGRNRHGREARRGRQGPLRRFPGRGRAVHDGEQAASRHLPQGTVRGPEDPDPGRRFRAALRPALGAEGRRPDRAGAPAGRRDRGRPRRPVLGRGPDGRRGRGGPAGIRLRDRPRGLP